MIKHIFIGVCLLLSILSVFAVHPDLVTNLPDFPYKGELYSGYLDTDKEIKKLHYLFVPSQGNPETDPLVLWLNGGPGCSSMLGWGQEHGPAVFPEESVNFEINPYSWNKNANVIYLESPAGVGYSYVDSKKEEDIKVDDVSSGIQNLHAVLSFFKKFPSFKKHEFYISGESYAGIYVPYLASNILKHNKDAHKDEVVNLKGMIIGNGVTDWNVDTTPAFIDFAYTHALYSDEERHSYEENCIKNFNKHTCEQTTSAIMSSLGPINIYDIYRKCYSNTSKTLFGIDDDHSFNYAPWTTNKSPKKSLKFLLENNLKDTPPCTDATGPSLYFNRPDVRTALNIKEDLPAWTMCSDTVGQNYSIDYERGSYYLYPELLGKIRITIYSGDTDGAVPINGTKQWIDNLNLKIDAPWRTWSLDNDSNVAGYVTEYEGLTFVTIKGTGHMVPQWKPREAFKMFNQFLKDGDL